MHQKKDKPTFAKIFETDRGQVCCILGSNPESLDIKIYFVLGGNLCNFSVGHDDKQQVSLIWGTLNEENVIQLIGSVEQDFNNDER